MYFIQLSLMLEQFLLILKSKDLCDCHTRRRHLEDRNYFRYMRYVEFLFLHSKVPEMMVYSICLILDC